MTVQEWLGEDNTLGIDIWTKKYQYNGETFDHWIERVSSGNDKLKQLIIDKKFLFGGRALANVNTGEKASLFNCYSRGFILDDFLDIMQANTDIAVTYKAQGGQGLSLTKLRPKGTSIGDRYFADGIVPFMKMYNATTEAVSQGGSRKGALMISLDAWHKEAEDFITIKSNDTEISKANLSLEVDDEFMRIVKLDLKNNTRTCVNRKEKYGKHIVEYEVYPIDVYKNLCKTSWEWADPAILYVDKFRNRNLMEFVEGYDIETSNPCSAYRKA